MSEWRRLIGRSNWIGDRRPFHGISLNTGRPAGSRPLPLLVDRAGRRWLAFISIGVTWTGSHSLALCRSDQCRSVAGERSAPGHHRGRVPPITDSSERAPNRADHRRIRDRIVNGKHARRRKPAGARERGLRQTATMGTGERTDVLLSLGCSIDSMTPHPFAQGFNTVYDLAFSMM